MQRRVIALLIKTQRALKRDSSCRAELSTLHELSQKCGEFIKGDRTEGGGESCNVEPGVSTRGRAGSQRLTLPLRSIWSFRKMRPKCWACGLRECLLTMTMTSFTVQLAGKREQVFASRPNDIRLRIGDMKEYRGEEEFHHLTAHLYIRPALEILSFQQPVRWNPTGKGAEDDKKEGLLLFKQKTRSSEGQQERCRGVL